MSQPAHKNEKDFKSSWVSSSRFLFYTQVFCIVAFIFGGCKALYDSRYKGKPTDAVPSSSSVVMPVYK
jgi:hypothetical protein